MEPIFGAIEEASGEWSRYMRAKRCFVAGGVLAASALNFSEQQLLNPPGSRVTVHVYRINVGAGAGLRIDVRAFDAALGTLVGPGANLWLGGPASDAQLRTATPAAADGVTITGLQRPTSPDATRYANGFSILEPGKGILLTTDAVNQEIGVEFFWAELPH